MTKLLIVDDEQFTVDMLQNFLQINGYETVGALNGEDGLVLVQVEQPEVVILDLMLPDIEGYEVCERIRSQPEMSSVPVLILSARTDAASKERAVASGANAYLGKPVQFKELLSELKRLLTMPVQPAEPPAPPPGPPNPVVSSTPDDTQPRRPVKPIGG